MEIFTKVQNRGKQFIFSLFSRRSLLLTVMMLLCAGAVFGTDYTWNGGATGDWNNNRNWNGGFWGLGQYPQQTGDNATISNAAINVIDNITVGNVKITGDTSFTGSGTLTITNLTVNAGQTLTIDSATTIKLTGSGTINGTLSGSGTLDLSGYTGNLLALGNLDGLNVIYPSGKELYWRTNASDSNYTNLNNWSLSADGEAITVFPGDIHNYKVIIQKQTAGTNYPTLNTTISIREIEVEDGASLTIGNSGAVITLTTNKLTNNGEILLQNNLTVSGYEGTGSIKADVKDTYIDLTILSDSETTINDIAIDSAGRLYIYGKDYDKPATRKKITINNFISVANGELSLYGEFETKTISVKTFSLEEGRLTVNGNIYADDIYVDGDGISVTGDVTALNLLKIMDEDSTLKMLTENKTVSVTGTFENDGTEENFVSNNAVVKFKGTTAEVKGPFSFYDVDATACTNLTFNGNVKVAGNFVSASTKTVFKGDADFSSATGYTARGDIDFFNTNEDGTFRTFKTFDGMTLKNFYCGGNVDFVINGAVSASSYNIPDATHEAGAYNMSKHFVSKITAGTGTSNFTIAAFDIGRSSNKDVEATAVTGKCYIDCDVIYTGKEVQAHVGSIFELRENRTFELTDTNGKILGTSYTTAPQPLFEIYGVLKVKGEFNLAAKNNPSCSRLTVYGTGSVEAKKIWWEKAEPDYVSTDAPVTVYSGGKITVTDGINVIEKANATNSNAELTFVNNGTVTVTSSTGTLSAAKYTGNGTFNFAGGTITASSVTDSGTIGNLVLTGSTTIRTVAKLQISSLKFENAGDKVLTIGTTGYTGVLITDGMTLSGTADHLLTVNGIGKLQFAGDLSGGEYLSVGPDLVIQNADGVVGAYTYTAANSVPSAGTSNADKALVIRHGWLIDKLSNLTYTWTGGAASGTAAAGTTVATDWSNPLNWDIKLCPVRDATVVIPATTDTPAVPSTETFEAGNLTVAAGAKITLKSQNLALSGMAGDAAASYTLVNAGTIVYTGDGRITDGSDVINDILNGGTVEYAKSTPAAAGVISDISYANLVVSGNTWTTENTTVSATGNVTVSGGTVTFDGDDGLEADGSFTLSGGTFSGKIKAASIAVTGAAVANGDFTFVSDDITVSRGITATNYTATLYPASDDKPVVFGTGVAGALSLTNTELGYLGAKTVILGSSTNTAGLTINQSMSVNSSIYLITGGTMSQTAGGTYTINSIRGELYLEAKDGIGDISGNAPVTIGSVNDTVSAKITGAGDIFLKIANTGTTTLGGEGSKVILAPNGNIKIETGGDMVLGGNIEATSGTLGLASGGTLTRTGGVLTSNDKITLSARGVIGSSVRPVEIDCDSVSAGTTSDGIYLSQDGIMKVSGAGDISVAAAPVFLKADDFDFEPGAVAAGSGTVTLTSHDAEDSGLEINQTKLNGITSTTARKLVLGDGSQTGGITVSGSVNLGSFTDTTFSSKVFNSSSAVISAGKVILSPVENEITLNGGFTFYDLEAKTMGGKTIKFGAGSTTKITNSLTLWGTSASSRLTLRSTADDSQWTVNCTCPSANTDIRWVDIKDSYNDSGYVLTATESTDSGNNDYWKFPGQLYTWTGADTTSPTKWAVKKNWSPSSVPCVDGNVTIPDGLSDYPLLESTSVNASNLITLGNGELTVNGQIDFATFGFTANKITNNGLVRMSGNAGGNNEITVNGVVVSTVSTDRLVNGADSTVEYYGDCGSDSLPWGKNYKNILFSDGAKVSLPPAYAISVEGTTRIANGSGRTVTIAEGSSFTGAVTLGISGGTQAGSVILSGNNTFGDNAKITINKAENVVLNGTGIAISSGASCDSLVVKSDATIGSVTTTTAVSGALNNETQIYEATVTLSTDSVFTGQAGQLIHFASEVDGTSENKYAFTADTADLKVSGNIINSGAVSAGANAEFGGTITASTVSVTGITTLTSASPVITTTGNQSYTGNVNTGADTKINATDSDVTFGADVTGAGNNLAVAAGTGTVTFTGDLGTLLDKLGAVSSSGASTVFNSDIYASSVSVTGPAAFNKTSSQTVTTSGTQTYSGDVTFVSGLTLDADGTVTFEGNVSGPADLTVNGTVTSVTAEKAFDLRDTANSEYKLLTLDKGFTPGTGANFVLYGNAVIHGSTDFELLKVLNNDYEKATSVTFDKDSVQTIRNPASASEVYFRGNSQSYPLTITGGSSGEHWNTVFVNKPAAENFGYVIIENSHSVTAASLANDLKIIPSVEYVQDKNNSDFTSKYWFSYDYYWFGASDNDWRNSDNWKYDAAGSISALGYPNYTEGTTIVKIAANSPKELILDSATFSAAPVSALNIKSLEVSAGTLIDFADQNVVVTDTITNNGKIRLEGTQTVTADSSKISNNTGSTVEYYADSGTNPDLGYNYYHLEFSSGAEAAWTGDLTVNGTTKIFNGVENTISLSGNNTFQGTVTLDDAGPVTFSGTNTFIDNININKAEDVVFSGANSYGGLVTVTSAGNVILNGNDAGVNLNDGANCTSLETGCNAKLGSVTTLENQTYRKNITLKNDSVFTSVPGKLVKIEGNVNCSLDKAYSLTVAGADAEFAGNIDVNSLLTEGEASFTNLSGQTVTSSSTQTYTGDINVTTGVTLTSTEKIYCKADVNGNGSITVDAGTDSIEVDGVIGKTNKVSSLSLSAGAILLHSGYDVAGAVKLAADSDNGTVTLKTADYVSLDTQTITARKGVRLEAGSAGQGNWTAGTKTIELTDTDLFVNCGSDSVILGSDLNTENIYFYNGTFTSSGKKVSAVNDIAVFGANYSADDPRYEGADTRFAFFGFNGLTAKPSAEGIQPSSSDFSSILNLGAGSVFAAGRNLYVNGTDLNGCTIEIPSNASSNPVFNPSADVIEKQWGIPYAIAVNSTLTDITVEGGWLCAAGSDGLSGGDTQGCTDGSGNSNVQFNVPHIDRAYSVYDDVIYVHFDMALENSNGEIATNLARLNGTLVDGGIWYSGAAYKITGAYADADCAVPVSRTEDIQEFYIRGEETWNTDASGLSSYTTSVAVNESSDRNGINKNVTTDLSFMEGLFTSAEGHTMGCNYGINLEAGSPSPAYTATEDKASPVLIAIYSGQEQHTTGSAETQPQQDGHNFIEFRYSEPVNIVTAGADMRADGTGTNSNVPAFMENSDSGLTVRDFGSIASGTINAGIKPGTSAATPHMFYRTFTTVAGGDNTSVQPYRIRLSVAGAIDGTVTYNGTDYHNFAGYINKASSPSGRITRSANANVTDLSGNELDAAGTSAEHVLPQLSLNGYHDYSDTSDHLYGEWDILPPVFAPFVSEYGAWREFVRTGTGVQHEIIGTSRGAFIDDLEIHMYDNNEDQSIKWSDRWWRTKRGWFTGAGNILTDVNLKNDSGKYLPDTRGGSRPFEGNRTTGGIRRSSLTDANKSFSYKAVDEGVEGPEKPVSSSTPIDQENIRNMIFRAPSDPATEQDGLYLKLPLADGDNTLPIRTIFALSYNPENDYITDLAGNRLASSYSEKTTFQSIDLTPPAYTMTLSPVAENKLYVYFTKRLAYSYEDGTIEYIDYLSKTEQEAALEDIKSAFVICREGTSTETIGISKVELVRLSSEYTTFLFTLDRKLTVSDIKSMWIRDKGVLPQITDTSTGLKMNNTKINDYVGNFLPQDSAHAISDFVINAVKPIYGFANEKNDDGWDEQGVYGTIAPDAENYAVHDFTRTQGNYGRFVTGRDITLQVQCIEGVDDDGNPVPGTDSYTLMSSKKASISAEMISDKMNRLIKSDWRLWLPTTLKSLASKANDNMLPSISGESAGDEQGLLYNYKFKDDVYNFKSGDEIQFIFQMDGVTIDHDGDSEGENPTPRVPLYAVTMPESIIKSGDFNFIDLWSFALKDITKQRGGVSILNNVINVKTREQTVVEVDMAEEGILSVYVMTLDGNIIRRLAHEKVSAGTHYYRWDGTNGAGNGVARGLYFIRVSGPGIDETRKVLCVKE